MNTLKTTIAIIVLLAAFITTPKAQTFQFGSDTSTLNGDAGEIIKVQNGITNLTQDSVEFRWVRASNNLPLGWQKCGVCDKNLCYNDADSATFFLDSAESGNMSINFYPFDEESNPVEGTGSLTVLVYPVDSGRSHGKEVFFMASTSSTGIENAEGVQFNLYPNPATDYLNFTPKTKGPHQITIFTTSGAKVHKARFKGQSTHRVNIKHLDKGTYVLQYQSQKGRMETISFVKQ